jgi:hypothetical protein
MNRPPNPRVLLEVLRSARAAPITDKTDGREETVLGSCTRERVSTTLSRSRLLGNLILTGSELGNIVPGVFTPVLAKHSKSFSLIDCISVGVDRMQRNFEPMRKQVEAWQRSELTDVTAKVVIYEAFVEGKLEAPKHLATVHELYFEPKYEDFKPRTIWSLSNAFTSAFKELEPIPQFKATAKLGEFLESRFSQSF